MVTDVTKRKDVERLRDAALKKFGHVDVWVNNAGRGIGKNVMELTDEDLDEMIRVNVKSVLYGMQAIVPHFQQRGKGHLINVSSFLGRVPLAAFRSAYNAAKHAVNALTANLRMDLRNGLSGYSCLVWSCPGWYQPISHVTCWETPNPLPPAYRHARPWLSSRQKRWPA